jgi:hypothetical protein
MISVACLLLPACLRASLFLTLLPFSALDFRFPFLCVLLQLGLLFACPSSLPSPEGAFF